MLADSVERVEQLARQLNAKQLIDVSHLDSGNTLTSRKLSFDDNADEGVNDLLLPCYSLDSVQTADDPTDRDGGSCNHPTSFASGWLTSQKTSISKKIYTKKSTISTPSKIAERKRLKHPRYSGKFKESRSCYDCASWYERKTCRHKKELYITPPKLWNISFSSSDDE